MLNTSLDEKDEISSSRIHIISLSPFLENTTSMNLLFCLEGPYRGGGLFLTLSLPSFFSFSCTFKRCFFVFFHKLYIASPAAPESLKRQKSHLKGGVSFFSSGFFLRLRDSAHPEQRLRTRDRLIKGATIFPVDTRGNKCLFPGDTRCLSDLKAKKKSLKICEKSNAAI